MTSKKNILQGVCYTDLVYKRINKKLGINYSNNDIENLVKKTVLEADKLDHKGKNYYIYDYTSNIRITINANNFRVITAAKLKF
ncbi:hypothetical protein G8J22_01129 [Lentilactobacillus hilgardii]|uniref:DUF3781 domain-containing protein n=1 Tax=Lentilactobacillus hilgardii TaxID=1588 RepID=UPI00019C593A|nr:DUF3781 domain-containing protein [Lentilactobacillus hilgardii]EEI18931.1 hypothetical protein HMPREF0497_2166 [Lentilactobacillus buchneri ATCC 11577]MCT3395391.1 DUF3781 domain-containing protein [Lentilactobacillus hilgardii]QIR09152.1 hypothetical protein G8J22_01129 [Lentilactobacillus hilgardii]